MKLIQSFMKSIRFRIVGLLLLCLIPSTLGGIFLLDLYTERQLKKIARKDLEGHAKLTAQMIRRLDEERQENTAFVASQPEIVNFQAEQARFFLNEFIKFHQWRGFFLVVNREGKIVASSDGYHSTKPLPLKRWSEEVAQAHRHLNRLFPGKDYNESKDCLIMPILSPGSKVQIGIIVECLPLPVIAELVQNIAKDAELDRILLVNYQGYIYADTSIKKYTNLENKQDSPLVNQLLNNRDGIIYSEGQFAYLSPIHLRGSKTWGIILEDSEASIEGAIFDINRVGYLLVVVIGIIVAVSSWMVIHHSTIPILQLTSASRAMAEGNLDYPITVRGEDEIGILGNSFIHMRNQIKTLIAQEIKDGMNRLELEKGRQIQQNFLPISLPNLPQWEINAVFEPARSVSGDFYDAFLLGDDYLAIVIGDVCDKGVGAAMFMGLFRSLLRVFSGATMPGDTCIRDANYKCRASDNDDDDGKKTVIVQFLNAVRLTNDYIATEHGDMVMFATLFFGVIDIKNGNLSYINAGHEPVFILNSQGIKHKLKSTGPAVGMMPQSTFTINSLAIDTGDMLIGYTDGVTDARSPNKEFFGRQRLMTMLTENFSARTEILTVIKQELISHIDNSIQFDDITMIAVYRN
ncbi:Serine phosphatase RsbU, regulator of sigma subunit [Synechocystis sp. PCC 6714]|nr:Serine phosphatase RsbU, regulator of sigma subunit [Synechocystis sp. PCC 6714]